LLLSHHSLIAQTIPVTPFSLENDLRVLQLSNEIDLDHSLTIRPFVFNKRFTVDSLYAHIGKTNAQSFNNRNITFLNGQARFSLFPLRNTMKYTSHHPYGWSDGIFKPVKGFQNVLSVGVYSRVGPLVIQVVPEFLYAQNLNYAIDSRWGDQQPTANEKRITAGQSKVAVEIGPFSLGLTNENVWWGPGQFTSLMMTNNAPGFAHITFNSTRPVKTPIGKFEWQLIGGRMIANDTLPEDVYDIRSYRDIRGVSQLDGDYNKYINAINIAYTPSFLRDLTLGINRTFVAGETDVFDRLSKEIGFRKSYLPIFDGLFKEKRNAFEDSLPWNQLASLYARWRFKRLKAEVYGEYGWNDHAFNARDLAMSVNHSAAFLIGFKKVVQITNRRLLDFSVEYNQMSQSPNYLVRDAGSWYTHSNLGLLSHRGEIVGSGVGYGADVFTLAATLRTGYNQIGIRFEKVKRIPGLSLDVTTNWNDYGIGLNMRQKMNQFLLNIHVMSVYSQNYIWRNNTSRVNAVVNIGLHYFWF